MRSLQQQILQLEPAPLSSGTAASGTGESPVFAAAEVGILGVVGVHNRIGHRLVEQIHAGSASDYLNRRKHKNQDGGCFQYCGSIQMYIVH